MLSPFAPPVDPYHVTLFYDCENRPVLSRPRPVQIGTEEVEGVQTYKYLGLWLDNRLDWTRNTRQLYKKTQSRMYFLRRLRSFNICRKLLWMFYQSVVASVLSYAVVCWGGSATKADLSRLEKLIRRASSVVGMKLKPLGEWQRGELLTSCGASWTMSTTLCTLSSTAREA
ncbi:hypothetical protein D4764_0184950 [Takifugu flavidus]|uniref:Alkylated DNA repair protein AlkB homologue 8 N-terminal domain-containing protein n=1 Tax=Takifugu flavidus TaxID=433684 RepID=A0A5C6MIF6_9TELE|nr:hypothetical protein D4764_0184950 [Takifugu flavidus]